MILQQNANPVGLVTIVDTHDPVDLLVQEFSANYFTAPGQAVDVSLSGTILVGNGAPGLTLPFQINEDGPSLNVSSITEPGQFSVKGRITCLALSSEAGNGAVRIEIEMKRTGFPGFYFDAADVEVDTNSELTAKLFGEWNVNQQSPSNKLILLALQAVGV